MKKRDFILLAAALVSASCAELKNELPAPVAPGVNVHDPSWSDQSSSGFHGKQLLAAVPSWNDASCRACHGGNYAGGSSGVACFKCHDPYPHSVQFPISGGRHRGYLASRYYPLAACQACHGASYTGGPVVAISCEQSGCHVDASGVGKSPETCNTCHGTFSASAGLTGLPLLLSAAPPNDVAGDTSISAPGVGAHQKHLVTGTTGKSVKCQECHTVPNRWDDPGHIAQPMTVAARSGGIFVQTVNKTAVASVVFNDTLARLVTGNGGVRPGPSFDPLTAKCSNTYCHGNWLITKSTATVAAQGVYKDTATVIAGAKAAPAWTAGASEGQCYSCHGGGPGTYVPAGHIEYGLTACAICHGDVVDANGKILNRAKHMNGVIDLVSGFGGPRPMR